MKTLSTFALALLLLAPCATRAASPSFQSFATNDFNIITNLNAPWSITANRFGVTNSFTNVTQIFTNSTIINTNVTITNVTIQESTFQSIFTNVNNYVYNTNVTNFYDNSTIIYTNTTIVIDGTNVATINPTDGYLPVRASSTSFQDSPIHIVSSALADVVFTGGVYITNFLYADTITASNTLATDGSFLTRALTTTLLAAGTNELNPANIGYFVVASTDPSAVIQLDTGNGSGQHLWILNYWTNATFTLPSGPLADDTNAVLVVRGGEWVPSEPGESIELLATPNGWVEIGRSNPNGGPPVVTSDNLWTNKAGILQPADFELPAYVKSLQTSNTLRTDGAFLTTHSAATTLAAGDNVLNLADISYLALASLDNSAVVKLTSGSGNGQHLWVFNFWTNATFTLPSGVCDDDTNVVVNIRGDAWSPTQTGESIELFRTTNGWVEINRANPSSGPPLTSFGDVLAVHTNGTLTVYTAAADTDIARGNALFSAVGAAEAGDVLWLNAATYDLGASQVLPLNSATNGVSLRGAGKYATRIKTQCNGLSVGVFIRLGNNSTVSDLSIISTPGSSVFSFPIGLNVGRATNAVMRNLYISGCSDCIYLSSTAVCTAEVRDCTLTSLYDCFNVSSTGGTFTIHDTTAVSTSGSGGFTDNGFGATFGEGTFNVFNTTVMGTGGAVANRGFNVGSGGTVNLYGCTAVASGTAPFDLFSSASTINVAPDVLFTTQSGSTINLSTARVKDLYVYGSATSYDSGKIVFGPGGTNVLYRSGSALVYTNSGTANINFEVYNGAGKSIALSASTGSSSIQTTENLLGLTANGIAVDVDASNNALRPTTFGLTSLGTSGAPWKQAYLTNSAGTNYIYFGTNTLSVTGSDLYWNGTKINP